MSPLNDRLESKYNVFEVSSKEAALNSKISFIKWAAPAAALALESWMHLLNRENFEIYFPFVLEAL